MSADTTDRTPLDDPLMLQLRATLDRVDAAEAARPSVSPPWARIQQGMGRARRRRRRARTVRIGAGLLALSTLGAGTVTGLIHYPSFVPIDAIPGIGGRSALDDGRTRGSLGTNTAWLSALREHIATGQSDHEPDGETWSPPGAGAISVLYAGDVGDYRVALVEGSWHWGPIGDRQQVWYSAPAGAPAADLVKGGNNQAQDLAAATFSPNSGESGQDSSAIVVLSSRPVRVELEESPAIGRTGKVTKQVRTLDRDGDAYQAALDTPGVDILRVDGNVIDGQFQATGSISPPPASKSALTPARGGALEKEKFAPADLGPALRSAVRQGQTAGEYQLLAAEQSYRDVGDLSVRALVGRVTLPGGATVIGVGQVTDGNMSPGGVVDEDLPHVAELENAWLLPAGNDADVSVAWRQPTQTAHADQLSDAGTTPALRGWTAAMGPVGTVSVEWVHDDRTVTTSTASNTLAVTDREDVRSVRFLDDEGKRLGTTPVRGLHAAVDPDLNDNNWLIPEVQAVLVNGGRS